MGTHGVHIHSLGLCTINPDYLYNSPQCHLSKWPFLYE